MGKKGAAEAPKADENIKVIVRCRPLNSKEVEAGYKACVDLNLSDATVTVNHLVGAPDRWTFDGVVDNSFSQRDVFTQFIMPLVDSVLDGFNATVFAYGQSGSGKTHTMTGKYDDPELMGVIPRSFRYIFDYIRNAQQTNPTRKYQLSCGFIELYNGKVRDLLAKQQVALNVKENKDKTFYVQGASYPQVRFAEDLIRLMEEGTERRQVASTELNADSSRSHSVFTLLVECIETSEDGDARAVTSKFNLVDLAGSERQSKTGAQGDTLKEGCNINLSLSALGTVIDTIVKGKGHVPFRSSPLTMLLKDSLGGSSKTVMFANMGPSEHNLSETVSTLRFADRAKQIKNKPVVNMDTKDQKIQELTELVNQLKDKLKALETGDMERLEQEVEELKERCGQLDIDLDNAVKGRDADRLEATQARDALKAELDAAIAARDEAIAKSETLKQEVTLAEQAVADEKRQREEVWSACSQQLGEEVRDIDTLLAKLKALEDSVPAEEHQKATSELRRVAAELEASEQTHQADLAQLRANEAAARDELEQANRKVEKMKEKLEKEKGARRHLIENQESAAAGMMPSPSKSEGGASEGDAIRGESSVTVAADNAAAATWLAQKQELEHHYREKIKKLEAQIEKLSRRGHAKGSDTGAADASSSAAAAELRARDETIAKLVKQIDGLTANQSLEVSEGDSVAVSNLKLLAAAKEEAAQHATREIERLEAQIKWYEENHSGGSVADIAKISHSHHAEQRGMLRERLERTTEHRDQLLNIVLEGATESGGAESERERVLAEQVAVLLAEVKALQKSTAASAAHAETVIGREDLEAERKAEIAHLTSQLDSVKESMKEAWQAEVEQLTSRLAAAEAAFAAREKELIALAMEGSSDERAAQLIEELQTEKALLTAERNKAHNELHLAVQALAEASTSESSQQPPAGASRARSGSSGVRRDSIVDALIAENSSDNADVAALKTALRGAVDSQDAASSAETPTPLKRALSGRIGGSGADSAELRAKVQVLEEEKAELVAELDALKSEASSRVEASKKDTDALRDDAATRAKEVAAAKINLAEEQNKTAELQAQIAKAAKDAEAFTATQQALENRLKEKIDQNTELRKLLDGQKNLLEATKAKVESLQQTIANMKEEVAERDKHHQQALRDQDAAAQRALNRRVEALVEEHHRALAKKDEDIQAAKKKVKRMEKEVAAVQQQYDEKVCEYEELVGRMEEQKFDAMRQLKGEEQLEIEDAQTAVGDALKRAKEEQKRKKDLFATGEVQSAVTGLRGVAQGSAAAAARAKTKPTTPTDEDVVPPRKPPSPRPQYAVVGSERNSGGAGFNSQMNYGRPATGAAAPGARPMTGAGGFAPTPPPAAQQEDGMYDF